MIKEDVWDAAEDGELVAVNRTGNAGFNHVYVRTRVTMHQCRCSALVCVCRM